MKPNLFTLSFAVLLLHLHVQSTAQIWTRIYAYTSGQLSDQGRSVVETDGGSLLVAGGYLGNLIKVDRNGVSSGASRIRK
jgi:hypothetical protein